MDGDSGVTGSVTVIVGVKTGCVGCDCDRVSISRKVGGTGLRGLRMMMRGGVAGVESPN